MMAMLTNQGKGANQKGGKSKNEKNSSSAKFDGKCNHCSKRGHKEDQCWIKHPELKPEKSRRDGRMERPKYSLMATTTNVAMPKRQSVRSFLTSQRALQYIPQARRTYLHRDSRRDGDWNRHGEYY